MTQVQIKHNPFTVQTKFIIDGVELTDGARLHRCTSLRMQLWVDQLFNELRTMFNGQNTFDVTFTGVEPDFHDLEGAAQTAREAGIAVNLEWVPTASAECRQADIEAMRKEVLAHPGYESLLKDDAASRTALLDSANHDFDVYIVATMSSGKSTLINALLGRDLLPAGNEATTATITRIYDNENTASGTFRGERYDASGELLETSDDVDLATMRTWNKDCETSRIELHGRIATARSDNGARLVLTDTPGPNNSGDEEHGRTTMRYIQDKSRNPLILYVLNATQRGITDDSRLLKLVADTIAEGGRQASDRFIFVLNKMDELDTEKGDDVIGMLSRTRDYLKDHGIHNPQIFPVSAYISRLARFPEELLSAKERGAKTHTLDWFGNDASMDLGSYSPLRKRERARLEARTPELERRTGLPALEAAIAAYIEKYHLPNRLKRNHDAMRQLIDEAINRHKGIEELEMGNVQELAAQIELIKARYENGIDGVALAEQIAAERLTLPLEVEMELSRIASKIEAYRRKDSDNFTGKVKLKEAKILVKEWGKEMSFRHKEVLNRFESTQKQSQYAVNNLLQERYKELTSSVFDNVDTVSFPALGSIIRSTKNLSFNPMISKSQIQTTQEIIRTEEVSDSRWYNPLSWFSTQTINIYDEVEYVDLREFYKKENSIPEQIFNELHQKARTAIVEQSDALINIFIEHVRNEFEPRVKELFAEAHARVKDRELRESALAQASELRHWSEQLGERLHQVLKVEDMPA